VPITYSLPEVDALERALPRSLENRRVINNTGGGDFWARTVGRCFTASHDHKPAVFARLYPLIAGSFFVFATYPVREDFGREVDMPGVIELPVRQVRGSEKNNALNMTLEKGVRVERTRSPVECYGLTAPLRCVIAQESGKFLGKRFDLVFAR
jgi:hypothetical protein